MLKLHKAESTCRTCHHSYKHHCVYVKVEQGDMIQPFVLPIDMVPCDSYTSFGGGLNMTAKCGCLDWQPMDNLEYLEGKSKEADEKADA